MKIVKKLLNAIQRVAWAAALIGGLAAFIAVAPELGFSREGVWVLWFYIPHALGAAWFFGEVTAWALFTEHAEDEPVLAVIFELAQRLIWLVLWIIVMFLAIVQLFGLIGPSVVVGSLVGPVALVTGAAAIWLTCGFAAWACATATDWATAALANSLAKV